jgi:FSR family fosmidomycin resistance protein-like MFS transporter
MTIVSATSAHLGAATPVVRTTAVSLALLSVGHFFVDLYSAALGALQPRLVEHLNLSLTQAGLLGGMLVFSSSLCQPIYGYLSDRFHSRLFTVLAPACAGIFISSLPAARSFAWLLPFVVLGGAGIAAFHPQASARATHGVASARGRWMAIFISSGTLGFALGPTFFSLVPAKLGFERTYLAAIPGILCSILLWFTLEPGPAPLASARSFDLSKLHSVWRPLTLHYFCVFIRSIVQVSFAQLIPLYLTRERAMPVSSANYLLSAYLAFGALGGFLGGQLSDRIGGRRVILISMIGCVPFLALFFFATGWLSILGLLLGGLMLLFTIPVNVIMAQELAPGQTGTVSALMMGFAWGGAGLIFVPLAGWLSETYAMRTVLFAFSLTPILGFFLALRLPDSHASR